MPRAAAPAPMPAVELMRALAFGALALSSAAGAAGAAEPVAIATPTAIAGADRSAVEREIAAAMDMTPPGRSITVDLASGARLVYSVSPYKAGAGGADCRDFVYAYRAPAGGSARVAGSRCRLPDVGWQAGRTDTVLETEGLPSTPAPSDDRADAAAPGAVPAAAPADSAATEPTRPAVRTPRPTANTAPPSRIILPFRSDESRPVARP